jgi:hypothetical protein
MRVLTAMAVSHGDHHYRTSIDALLIRVELLKASNYEKTGELNKEAGKATEKTMHSTQGQLGKKSHLQDAGYNVIFPNPVSKPDDIPGPFDLFGRAAAYLEKKQAEEQQFQVKQRKIKNKVHGMKPKGQYAETADGGKQQAAFDERSKTYARGTQICTNAVTLGLGGEEWSPTIDVEETMWCRNAWVGRTGDVLCHAEKWEKIAKKWDNIAHEAFVLCNAATFEPWLPASLDKVVVLGFPEGIFLQKLEGPAVRCQVLSMAPPTASSKERILNLMTGGRNKNQAQKSQITWKYNAGTDESAQWIEYPKNVQREIEVAYQKTDQGICSKIPDVYVNGIQHKLSFEEWNYVPNGNKGQEQAIKRD